MPLFPISKVIGKRAIAAYLKKVDDSPMKKIQLNKNHPFTMFASNHGQTLDLYLYGTIGNWENSLSAFLEQMRGYENAAFINLYISTAGGYFEDALPMFNILKQHPAEKTVIVMGQAWSWGSYMMLVASPGKLKATNNSTFMIHRPETWTDGNVDELQEAINMLLTHEKSVIPEYQARLQLDYDAVLQLMSDETWYSAQEALDAGLIDEIVDPIDTSAFDAVMPKSDVAAAMARFKHPPTMSKEQTDEESRFLKFLNKLVGKQTMQAATFNQPEELEMTKEEVKALLAEDREKLAADVADKVTVAMLAHLPKKEPEPDPVAVAMQAKEDKIAELEAKVAMLSKPHNETVVDENTGAADETGEYSYG